MVLTVNAQSKNPKSEDQGQEKHKKAPFSMTKPTDWDLDELPK